MSEAVYIYVTPFFPEPGDWRCPFGIDFVRAVQNTGRYRVEVFLEGRAADYELGGVRVHAFPAWHLPSNVMPFVGMRRNARLFLAAIARAGIALEDVAICHANTVNYAPYALELKKSNPKCIALLHHHDLGSFGLMTGMLRHVWAYNMVMFPFWRRIHELIDLHVFISERSRQSFLMAPDTSWTDFGYYKKQMRWLPYRSAHIGDSVVLHNGVDRSVFTPEGRVAHDGFIIGCVGNFIRLKDQMTLLMAVERLASTRAERIKVVFMGSGATMAKCRRYARRHGIDAEFLSEMQHERLADFYRGLDLFVLPSYFEGFGCVYTEAWCCGTPFIACEGQGIEDVIPSEDRGRWLCRQKDPVNLASKIADYMDNRWEQRLVENCDINLLVGRFLDSIERAAC